MNSKITDHRTPEIIKHLNVDPTKISLNVSISDEYW